MKVTRTGQQADNGTDGSHGAQSLDYHDDCVCLCQYRNLAVPAMLCPSVPVTSPLSSVLYSQSASVPFPCLSEGVHSLSLRKEFMRQQRHFFLSKPQGLEDVGIDHKCEFHRIGPYFSIRI